MARVAVPHGRANTDRKKGLVIEKLLRAWKLVPDKKLMELIDGSPKAYVLGEFEDDALAEHLLEYARRVAGVTVKKAKP